MNRPFDVEGAMVAALKSRRPLVKFSTRVPADRLGVRVSRAGGNRINLAQESPTLIFECWAANEVAAFELAAQTWGDVDNILTDDDRFAQLDDSLSSPTNFPDGVSSNPRYQFTAQVIANLEVSS